MMNKDHGDGGRPCRVLVVDDDPPTRELLSEQLSEGGHATVTAANGREALAVLESDEVQLVILDLEMPVMDGWELRRRMLADRSFGTIPTVVLSSHVPTVPHALGAAAVVRKPVGLSQLLTLVDRLVQTDPSGSRRTQPAPG